jgi:hypothetical protein
MKSTLSSFVAFLCLLAFFVSSAVCLASPMVQQSSTEVHIHSMSGTGHACCPNKTPDAQVSNACCTIHHQPASPVSDAEWQQHGIVLLAAFQIPSLSRASSQFAANFKPAPLQQPPLIALRI